MLQDAACPHTCRDGVASVDANRFAFQVFRIADGRFRVSEDSPMVKNSGGENGYRGEGLSMCLGTEICRKRELANIEFRTPHHPAECLNQNGDVLIFHLKALGLDRAIPERLGVSKRAKNGFKHGVRRLNHPNCSSIWVISVSDPPA